ncbi:hypothetical protein DYST_03731 [Dyella terrae]|nr:hypothetical protein DYST_03731 [Dyella terrae]
MSVNWKRGITRCYVVAWVPWLISVALRSELLTPDHLIKGLISTVIVGVMAPALLLLGIRWAIDGFRASELG